MKLNENCKLSCDALDINGHFVEMKEEKKINFPKI